MANTINKQFYNTVLSQAYSPCGNYLIVGDIYGTISVYHISKILNPQNSSPKEDQLPKVQFTVKSDIQINSLLATPNFLIVGTVGEIFGYAWKAIKTKNPSVSWSLEIPCIKDAFDKTDINCLVYDEDIDQLYVGCGDNNIYVFNLENHKHVRTLSAHSDYIHCFSYWNGDLVSAGEDGKVIMWDSRVTKPVNKIEPHLNDKVKRYNLGKWIGSVDMCDDWLVCGGGPRLSLWHSRFLNNSTVFPIEDEGIYVARFVNNKVFAGGRSKYFYQMNFNGEIVTEIPTSAVTTYSMIYQEEPFKALCVAGSSPYIDVSGNFIYKDLQLVVP